MLHSEQIEELICAVSSLDRPALVHQFKNFPASFPVDFTNEFLNGQSLERLRHIFLALCLEQQRLPTMYAEHAA